MDNNNFEAEILKDIDIRIDALYQSLGNDNTKSYKKLVEILRNYTDKDATELTAFDIKGINEMDYAEILSILGINPANNMLMVRQYTVYSRALEEKNNPEDFAAALDYLNIISTKICQYASEFKSVSLAREDYTDSQIRKFTDLKNVINHDSTSIVSNVKEIEATMDELGTPTEQRWKVLKGIAQDNLKILPGRVADLETYNKVKSSQKYANNYLEIAMVVKDYINKNGIDVDTVPLTAAEICRIYEIPNIDIITNIIVGVVSASYYKEYQNRLASLDPTAEEVKKDINRLCRFLIDDQTIRLHEAEQIVKTNYNSLMEAIKNEEDIFSYNDIYLSEFTDEETYEQAKSKKVLPIVYSLGQTIDTYNSEKTGVKAKAEAQGMINSLTEAYHDINDRRFTPKLVA